MAVQDGFVTAIGPDGKKRRVPQHYLTNKRLGYKRPPSQRASQRQVPPEPDKTPKKKSSSRQADTTTKETT